MDKVYQFNAELAKIYGVDQAIMIWNLAYWIDHNEANNMHYHDGRTWTYNSVEAFTKLFPFWSRAQVRRILNSLEEKGVIMTGNYNTNSRDRTTWYAFTDSFRQMHLSKSANGIVKNGKCINDSNSNKDSIYSDNKPDSKPVDGGLFPEPVSKIEEKRKGRRTSEPQKCLFADSRYNDLEKFEAEFQEIEFENVDLVYYFNAVADWSARSGAKYKDWIATARSFMRRDRLNGKLVMVKSAGGLDADAVEYLKQMAH